MKDYISGGLFSFIVFLMLWGQTGLIFAQTDGEALYSQGKFKEALEAFRKADMDHPKDVRFRYNSGCAAFQNADIDGSEAAFTSVLRRTDDNNIRFRALYNRGAASFKKGEFAKAAIDFKEALKIKQDDEDARSNFELSLYRKKQAEEEEKKRKEEKSENQKSGQEQPDLEKNNGTKDKKDSNKSQKSSKDGNDSQKEQRDKETQDKKGQGIEEDRKDRAKTEPDALSGDLEGEKVNDAGLEETKQGLPPTDTQMARNRAEALLENITDDRSMVLKGQKAQGKQTSGSGKRW